MVTLAVKQHFQQILESDIFSGAFVVISIRFLKEANYQNVSNSTECAGHQ